MNVEVESMLAVNELLRTDQGARDAYFELLDALQACDAPRRDRPKSRPAYVFDQTALVGAARTRLEELGWAREEMIHEQYPSSGSPLAPVRADMSKSRFHAIFEFGNRASYAYNTLGRFALGTIAPGYVVTAFVVPTTMFANRIDSNLATFERLAAEFRRLEQVLPRMIPGPLLIVGLEPEHLDADAFPSTRRPGRVEPGQAHEPATTPQPSQSTRPSQRSKGDPKLLCASCGKRFKTAGGLTWHQENIADCHRRLKAHRS